ncbi:hypothetical protein NFI95_00035 [Acetobacteraceae bacterium KSS8]|uniref:Uncharacterized protein n=1 Tax=Endosaccharibacter trunci TaxID=2812733 RepID=A0ABT1W1T4_9PROT|nr:hypothetical protein [Acetobacteraceae bacterium KSS8]
MTGTPAPTPAHDWLRPRLDQLLADAEAHGIEREIAVAVVTDIVTGTDFGGGHLAGDTDA